MRKFLRDMWATFWLFVWLAVGLYLTVQGLRWLNGDRWQQMTTTTRLSELQWLDSVETAVAVIGTLFAGTWGLRFLDRLIFRGALISRLGFAPGAPTILGLLAFNLVHSDDAHLFRNTRNLLLFAGVMAFLVPSLQAYLIATLVIIVVTAIGLFRFASKEKSFVGAGIILGYYSFNILYGFFAMGIGGSITAIILLLLFGRSTWGTLRLRDDEDIYIGHNWGFIGGIVGAAVLMHFGYVPI